MADMSKSPDRTLKYEQAIEHLEQIVQQIESGQVGLEDSLKLYEQGTKLIQHCRQVLSQAEQKIQILSVDAKGSLQIESEGFSGDDAAN